MTEEGSGKRRSFVLTAGLLVVLWAVVAVLVGTAAEERATATTVRVQLREWKVVPSMVSVRSGKVTFVVRNVGNLSHDFVVLRTNLAPGKLPTVGARAKEVGRVGKTSVFIRGQTRRLTLKLKPGKYVLICNVPGHYKAGMFVGFRVR